jgi:hypothetical protein
MKLSMIQIFIFLFISCADAEVKDSRIERCQSNEECPSRVCIQGNCSQMYFECSTDQDCPNGRCVSGSCYQNECIDGQKMPCSSPCGVGESLCVGGVWRSCNAPMSGLNGCRSEIGQIVDRMIVNSVTDMTIDDEMIKDRQMEDFEIPDMNMEIPIDMTSNPIIEMDMMVASPSICSWMAVTGASPISYGMKEIAYSELLSLGGKYLSYFSELDFSRGTNESFLTITDLINNQIILPSNLHNDLIYDAKIIANHSIIASANGFNGRFLKFNSNQQMIANGTSALTELRSLQLSSLANDYAVVWISEGQSLRISKLSNDLRTFNTIRTINLQAFVNDLNLLSVENEGLLISYAQTTPNDDQINVLLVDLQGNIRIAPKQVAIGSQPLIMAYQGNYELLFIDRNQKLSFLKLDQDLNPIGQPQILQNQGNHLGVKAIPTADKIYYTWYDSDFRIWIGEIDHFGNQRIDPLLITQDGNDSTSRISVLNHQISVSWHHRLSDFSAQLYFQTWEVSCQ